MKKPKYCETLKEGFYLFENKSIGMKRCVYATGTLRDNKWIELNVPNPKWVNLSWNCFDKHQMENSSYHETNPISFTLP